MSASRLVDTQGYKTTTKIGRRIYMRKYMRLYRETHKEECRAHSRNWKKKHPENHKKHREKWNKKNPEKVKVHNITNRHYSSTPKVECSLCGSTKTLQRHHPDYDKPLDTIVVCQVCHKALHGET